MLDCDRGEESVCRVVLAKQVPGSPTQLWLPAQDNRLKNLAGYLLEVNCVIQKWFLVCMSSESLL